MCHHTSLNESKCFLIPLDFSANIILFIVGICVTAAKWTEAQACKGPAELFLLPVFTAVMDGMFVFCDLCSIPRRHIVSAWPGSCLCNFRTCSSVACFCITDWRSLLLQFDTSCWGSDEEVSDVLVHAFVVQTHGNVRSEG